SIRGGGPCQAAWPLQQSRDRFSNSRKLQTATKCPVENCYWIPGRDEQIWLTPCVKLPGEREYPWRRFRGCSTTLNISLKKPASVCSMPFVNSTTSRTCMPGGWRLDVATYLGWSFPRLPIPISPRSRSEEHTSELQSRVDLVCRL